MSKSPKFLYVKGMNIYDTDDDDQWDDKKLNDAYDKAVRIANIEVAKRVAMSTNTSSPTNDPVCFKKDKMPSKSSMKKDEMSKGSKNITVDERPKEGMWRPGMPCRLMYKEDGLEYEAVIVKLVENDDCVVRYLGYENQELVSVESLMPSHGKEARARQITEAMTERVEDNYEPGSPSLDRADLGFSDQMPSPDSMDRASPKKKKPSKKKKNQARNLNINGFEFPEIPPMPNLAMLNSQLGAAEMPMPPPPMAFSSSLDRIDSEDQAISSMLLSWYMSGYYTGLYQGMKRAKEGRRN